MNQSRTVIQPSGGGASCTNEQNQTSRQVGCTQDINCVVSGWGACNTSTRTQTRTITTAQSGTGSACPSLTQSCVPDINCVGSWSACAVIAAGPGAQNSGTQTYTVTQTSSGTGTPCQYSDSQSRACSIPACAAGSSWSVPSSCNWQDPITSTFTTTSTGQCYDSNHGGIYYNGYVESTPSPYAVNPILNSQTFVFSLNVPIPNENYSLTAREHDNVIQLWISLALSISYTQLNIVSYQSPWYSIVDNNLEITTCDVFIHIYGTNSELATIKTNLESQIVSGTAKTIPADEITTYNLSTPINPNLYRQPFQTNSPMMNQFKIYFPDYSGSIYYITK